MNDHSAHPRNSKLHVVRAVELDEGIKLIFEGELGLKEQLESLLETLEAGDVETGVQWIKNAIKLLEREGDKCE